MTQFHFIELDEDRQAVYLCRKEEKCKEPAHANMIGVGWINDTEDGFVFTPKASASERKEYEPQTKVKYCLWDVWDFVRNRKQLSRWLT